MKYGLFFFMIFMMITSIKVYLNYANIQQNITDVKAKIVQRQKDMLYLHLQNAYYHSPYAEKLTAHQEGILLPGEQFILFEHIDPNGPIVATGSNTVSTGVVSTIITGWSLSPLDSRRDYLQQKIDKIP